MSDPTSSQHLFDSADQFTRSYISVALTLAQDEFPEGFDVTAETVQSDSMRRMIADCTEFQKRHADVLYDALSPLRASKTQYSPSELAGSDFWLTRNGHGAGFWDGDWVEPHATYMDNTSVEFGQQDLVLGDDGLIHVEGGLVLEHSTAPTPG